MTSRYPARIITSVITTACLIAAPLSATAQTDNSTPSYAEGRFLTGTVAGVNLDTIVELAGARATNDGSAPQMEVRNPLSITALNSLQVASTPLTVTGFDGASAGVLAQYARAGTKGESFASVGALRNDGALAIDAGSETSARIQLAPLLGSDFTQKIANLSLAAKTVGAQAQAQLTGFSSDYTLAGVRLDFEAPAVKSLPGRALTLLRPIEAQLATLAGPTGAIAKAVDRVLRQRDVRLGILGSSAQVSVSVDADLRGILASAMSTVLRDPAITIELESGAISVDLAKLPSSKDLNGLAPGTEMLSPAVVSDIVGGIMRLVSRHLDGVENTLRKALKEATVVVHAEATVFDQTKTGDRVIETVSTVTQVVDKVTGKVLGILNTDTGKITSLVPGVTGSDLDRALKGLLGGLLANLLGLQNGVTTKVVETVEKTTEPVFSMLESSVDLRLLGTVNQFLAGAGVVSSVDVTILGAPASLGAALVVGSVSNVLDSALLAATSTVPRAINQISTSLLTPVGDAITSKETSSLQSILGSVLSVKANVQETVAVPGGGTNFTQSALKVSVLDDLAAVSLANATIGLNSGNIGGGPGPIDDEPVSEDGATLVPASGNHGALAFTGVAWVLFAILLGLALATLGAIMYMRRRRAVLPGTESDMTEEILM